MKKSIFAGLFCALSLCSLTACANDHASDEPQPYVDPESIYMGEIPSKPVDGMYFMSQYVTDYWYFSEGPWIVIYNDVDADMYDCMISVDETSYWRIQRAVDSGDFLEGEMRFLKSIGPDDDEQIYTLIVEGDEPEMSNL